MNYFVQRNLGFVLVLIVSVSESHGGQQTLPTFQQCEISFSETAIVLLLVIYVQT